MKSFFKELETELYDIINNSPLPIDAKYYVVQSLYREISNAYTTYLNMPEQEEKIQGNDNIKDDTEDFKMERIENEDGSITVKTEGKNIGKVIGEAFSEMQKQD